MTRVRFEGFSRAPENLSSPIEERPCRDPQHWPTIWGCQEARFGLIRPMWEEILDSGLRLAKGPLPHGA